MVSRLRVLLLLLLLLLVEDVALVVLQRRLDRLVDFHHLPPDCLLVLLPLSLRRPPPRLGLIEEMSEPDTLPNWDGVAVDEVEEWIPTISPRARFEARGGPHDRSSTKRHTEGVSIFGANREPSKVAAPNQSWPERLPRRHRIDTEDELASELPRLALHRWSIQRVFPDCAQSTSLRVGHWVDADRLDGEGAIHRCHEFP